MALQAELLTYQTNMNNQVCVDSRPTHCPVIEGYSGQEVDTKEYEHLAVLAHPSVTKIQLQR